MSDYYITAILLEGCKYSINAKQLLENNNINAEIINVNQNNKENYKTNEIKTFPQIYLCKYNNKGTQLLGGYTELYEFISDFKNKQLNLDKVSSFEKKNKWSRKATLRLIQLINLQGKF